MARLTKDTQDKGFLLAVQELVLRELTGAPVARPPKGMAAKECQGWHKVQLDARGKAAKRRATLDREYAERVSRLKHQYEHLVRQASNDARTASTPTDRTTAENEVKSLQRKLADNVQRIATPYQRVRETLDKMPADVFLSKSMVVFYLATTDEWIRRARAINPPQHPFDEKKDWGATKGDVDRWFPEIQVALKNKKAGGDDPFVGSLKKPDKRPFFRDRFTDRAYLISGNGAVICDTEITACDREHLQIQLANAQIQQMALGDALGMRWCDPEERNAWATGYGLFLRSRKTLLLTLARACKGGDGVQMELEPLHVAVASYGEALLALKAANDRAILDSRVGTAQGIKTKVSQTRI